MASAQTPIDAENLPSLIEDLKLSTDEESKEDAERQRDVENLQALIEDVTEENFDDTIKALLLMDLEELADDCIHFLFYVQIDNPHFTHVYAGLVTILNAKWPKLGERLVRSLMRDFKDGSLHEIYHKCESSAAFLTHLSVQEVIPEAVVDQLFEYLLIIPSGFTIWACFTLYREQFGFFFWTHHRLRKMLLDANDLIRSGELVLERNDLQTFYDFQSAVDYNMEQKNKPIYKEPGLKKREYRLELEKNTHKIGFLD